MSKLPIAKDLSDGEYKLLLTVYADHNCSMGMEERKQYTLSDIVKVEKNPNGNSLDVYYGNGERFRYFADGTWS